MSLCLWGESGKHRRQLLWQFLKVCDRSQCILELSHLETIPLRCSEVGTPQLSTYCSIFLHHVLKRAYALYVPESVLFHREYRIIIYSVKGSTMLGIRFMQRIRQEGSAIFCYNAVRPLGEDFEESVGYNFTFLEGGAMDEMFGQIIIQNLLSPNLPRFKPFFSGCQS